MASSFRRKAKESSVISVRKCFSTLKRPMRAPTRFPMRAAPRSGRRSRRVAAAMASSRFLGGGEQVFALAAALLGEPGVEADHQALPGVAVGGDLGQVPPVEQGGVHRAGFDQGADIGGAQRGDPAEALLRAQVLADAPGGEHPPVADQDQLAEAEAVAEFGHLGGHRLGVGGVAGEDLDGDRAALLGAEQAEDDLQGVAPAVPAVTALPRDRGGCRGRRRRSPARGSGRWRVWGGGRGVGRR